MSVIAHTHNFGPYHIARSVEVKSLFLQLPVGWQRGADSGLPLCRICTGGLDWDSECSNHWCV